MSSPRKRRLRKLERLKRAGLVESPVVVDDKSLLEEVEDVVEAVVEIVEEAVEDVVEAVTPHKKRKSSKKSKKTDDE